MKMPSGNAHKCAPRKDHPTQNRLKELLGYDPITGLFTWLVDRRNAKIGDIIWAEAYGRAMPKEWINK